MVTEDEPSGKPESLRSAWFFCKKRQGLKNVSIQQLTIINLVCMVSFTVINDSYGKKIFLYKWGGMLCTI